MKVLDIGCGLGLLTVPVATAVGLSGEVVAMDIQIGMIQRAEKKVELAKLDNVKFVHAGVGENDLGQEKFDRILLVTVLGEIPNRESALAALKPGGIFSITEIIFDPHFQSRKTVLKLAHAAGFSEKDFFGNCIAYTLNLDKPLLKEVK